MRAFLATVLSVIAVGVVLIAYGLLAPRMSAASPVVYDPQSGVYQLAQPAFAGERLVYPNGTVAPYGYQQMPAPYGAPVAYPTQTVYAEPAVYRQAPAVRTVRT